MSLYRGTLCVALLRERKGAMWRGEGEGEGGRYRIGVPVACTSVVCSRTQHEQIEAKQLTKQLNNYVQRFDRLLSQERDLTRQHQDLTDSGEPHNTHYTQ